MQRKFRIFILSALMFAGIAQSHGQFAPPAGMPGTTAIYKDSSAFVSWASGCTINRGFVMISDTNFMYYVNGVGSNHATYGLPEFAVGKADDSTVVSLGDGGYATLTFNGFIKNGPGYDFAVFENALTHTFLELGFVEVSSDGINFFRFPSTSLSDPSVQIPSFGSVDATKIDNLAGKYRSGFGTPFDLDTLKNTAGLDLERISHVRIVDVVGCIQPAFATHDALGNPVNDLWPTPYNTSGFDLDGVGVIHFTAQGTGSLTLHEINLYPNPFTDYIRISTSGKNSFSAKMYDISGKEVFSDREMFSGSIIPASDLPRGLYLITVTFSDGSQTTKKITRW